MRSPFRKNYRSMRIVHSDFHKTTRYSNKRMNLTVLVPVILIAIGVLYLSSCSKKQNSLAVFSAANINIFNASHVYDSMIKRRDVYLSGFDTTITMGRLVFWGSGYNELPNNGLVEAIRTDHPIHYYPFVAGRQRVQFSDTSGNVVADSYLGFSSGGNYTVYLADDTAMNGLYRSGAFRIFSFQEENTNTPSKVRLRYINLIPDVDTLNGYFFTSTGTKFTSPSTPNALTYGTASNYYDLDTAGLVVGGKMLLRMFRKKDTANYYTQVTVPPTPGRTYTVLFFGNTKYYYCSFPVKQPDGTVKQKVINYPPNMSGYVRTVN